jgi:hypothetical protein
VVAVFLRQPCKPHEWRVALDLRIAIPLPRSRLPQLIKSQIFLICNKGLEMRLRSFRRPFHLKSVCKVRPNGFASE